MRKKNVSEFPEYNLRKIIRSTQWIWWQFDRPRVCENKLTDLTLQYRRHMKANIWKPWDSDNQPTAEKTWFYWATSGLFAVISEIRKSLLILFRTTWVLTITSGNSYLESRTRQLETTTRRRGLWPWQLAVNMVQSIVHCLSWLLQCLMCLSVCERFMTMTMKNDANIALPLCGFVLLSGIYQPPFQTNKRK